jgi:hypothetical protein
VFSNSTYHGYFLPTLSFLLPEVRPSSFLLFFLPLTSTHYFELLSLASGDYNVISYFLCSTLSLEEHCRLHVSLWMRLLGRKKTALSLSPTSYVLEQKDEGDAQADEANGHGGDD